MPQHPTRRPDPDDLDEHHSLARFEDGLIARERRLARVCCHPNGQIREQLLIHERELRDAPPTLVPSEYPAPPTDGLSAGDTLALLLALAAAGAGGWLGWQIAGAWPAAFGAAAGLLVSTTISAGAGSARDRARSVLHLVLAIAAIAGATALGALAGGPTLELALFLAALAAAVLLVPQS